MPTTTESPPDPRWEKPVSASELPSRTSDLLRRVDDGVEQSRRLQARRIVWDSLFAGWDEPANRNYADMLFEWDRASADSWEDSDAEYQVGFTRCTLMSLGSEFVGPQTPVDPYDVECWELEEPHEWGTSLVAERQLVDSTEANLEAFAYQLVIVGDITATQWALQNARYGGPFSVTELVRAVNAMLREHELSSPLPPQWWEPSTWEPP